MLRTELPAGKGVRKGVKVATAHRLHLATPVARPAQLKSRVACRASSVMVEKVELLEVAIDGPPATPLQTLSQRHATILKSFPGALSADDFMARVEVVLASRGFTGDTTIAMTNLCRDEVTVPLKDKIEAVFGSSFNTNGLGGVLTCGATGMGAGFSHSPVSDLGKERYVFFSFPHIAIDSDGQVGVIYRPGRPGKSCACGAMAKILGELKTHGVAAACKVPGVHSPEDPEYSILKQRLARRVRYEQLNVNLMSMADLTTLAEQQITSDLEALVERTVNPAKADYAVITGVQIHNWAVEGTDEPHLEFVFPGKLYYSVDGEITKINLAELPALTPRQISLLASVSEGRLAVDKVVKGQTAVSDVPSVPSTLAGIPSAFLSRRLGAPMLGGKGSKLSARRPLQPVTAIEQKQQSTNGKGLAGWIQNVIKG